MKRKTAAQRIRTHLKDYEKRLAKDKGAFLYTYWTRTGQDCPLCRACIDGEDCFGCLGWPDALVGTLTPCMGFLRRINKLKTRAVKLRWIAKLYIALDEWVAKENA